MQFHISCFIASKVRNVDSKNKLMTVFAYLFSVPKQSVPALYAFRPYAHALPLQIPYRCRCLCLGIFFPALLPYVSVPSILSGASVPAPYRCPIPAHPVRLCRLTDGGTVTESLCRRSVAWRTVGCKRSRCVILYRPATKEPRTIVRGSKDICIGD